MPKINKLYLAECAGKEQHTELSAQYRIENVKFNVLVAAYKCRFCGHWHIGKENSKGEMKFKDNGKDDRKGPRRMRGHRG